MESETYVTSQGEIVRREVNKDAIKVEQNHDGMLTGIWDSMKSTTAAAAHMAEMAVTIAGEAAHNANELLDKGMEKAHEAGEMIAATLHIGAEEAKENTRTLSRAGSWHAGIQLQAFADVIVEQSKEMSEKASSLAQEVVLPTVQQVAEQVVEKGTEVVQAVVHAGEGVVENVAEKMPVKEMVEQAKTMVAGAVETVKENMPVEVKEMAEQAKTMVAEAVEIVKENMPEMPEQAKDMVEQAKSVLGQVVEVVAPAPAPAPVQQKALPRSRSFKRSMSQQAANVEPGWNQKTLELTMDVVSHLQRIADRTGDSVLHETARRAHSACAKGLSEAPGVHLTWVTPLQANDLVNLAIRTQDHELADFARYCQSVAATSHIAVEPTPGKIQAEILKGHQELQKGRVHIGPGYGAAFASVNRTYALDLEGPNAPPSSPMPDQVEAIQMKKPLSMMKSQSMPVVSSAFMKVPEHISNAKPPALVLSMDVVSHIQRIADRTGNPVLHETAKKAHSAFAKGLSDAPGVHLTWITPEQASELMNLASKTTDKELVDFARYCQSVAATTQVGVEPAPGKIQQEIEKGKIELQLLQSQQPSQEASQLPAQEAPAPLSQAPDEVREETAPQQQLPLEQKVEQMEVMQPTLTGGAAC